MSKQAIDLMGTALILASRGRFVFPCLPCDKRPATARGYKDATIDPDVIRQWWHQEPNYKLAIATGAISCGRFANFTATKPVFSSSAAGIEQGQPWLGAGSSHSRQPRERQAIRSRYACQVA